MTALHDNYSLQSNVNWGDLFAFCDIRQGTFRNQSFFIGHPVDCITSGYMGDSQKVSGYLLE